jgi:hypothetical protein
VYSSFPREFERKCEWISVAVEKVEGMLESTTAWESQYKDIADLEEVQVPECAESFMTLLYTITGWHLWQKTTISNVTNYLHMELQVLKVISWSVNTHIFTCRETKCKLIILCLKAIAIFSVYL